MFFKVFAYKINLFGSQDVLLAKSNNVAWDVGKYDIDVHVNEVISMSHVDYKLGRSFNN